MAERLLPAIAQVVGVAVYLRPRPYDPYEQQEQGRRLDRKKLQGHDAGPTFVDEGG